MEWYRVVFCLRLKLFFDVSVSSQTGRRLDMISCLETPCTFSARICWTDRLLLFNFGNSAIWFSCSFSRDWETGPSWRAKRIEMTLFGNGYHRLFDATLAAEIVPLSMPNRWILQMIGKSSSNVALSRPTSVLASNWARMKDSINLLVVPWGCINERLCGLTNRFQNSTSVAWILISAQMWTLGVDVRSRCGNGGGETWSEEPTIPCALSLWWSGENPTMYACSVAASTKNDDASGRRLS